MRVGMTIETAAAWVVAEIPESVDDGLPCGLLVASAMSLRANLGERPSVEAVRSRCLMLRGDRCCLADERGE